MSSVSILNLGCKVNSCEGDGLARLLRERGYSVTVGLCAADIFILNTCAVTREAEKKSRQAIARAVHLNPQAMIYVCGCAAQKNSSQFEGKQNVVYVSGVSAKSLIASFPQGVSDMSLATEYEDDLTGDLTRTRAYVKIQDGCNNFCSYCIVPYLRGRSRSRSIQSILAECTEKSALTDEIVLTGIDISSYRTAEGQGLWAVIDALSDLDTYIRLGSLEVGVIDDRLLRSLRGLKHFCPHFHLSLQSGDDAVLHSMNRHYTAADYLDRVTLIRRYFPQAAITTDIIVGYVTESEEQFANSLRFAAEVGFADIHVFPYSPREGTAAYRLGSLSPSIVADRVQRMTELKHTSARAYCQAQNGGITSFFAEEHNAGYTEGYTPEYVRVRLTGELPLSVRYRICLTDNGTATMSATLIESMTV